MIQRSYEYQHHNHVGENDNFIPYEHEVVVKNECVLLGKHIGSVKIHTREDFINHNQEGK